MHVMILHPAALPPSDCKLVGVAAGSSEALLSGQKPPFRLFVCARNVHDGSPVDVINFVVSEPFVVATPRVRTAAKANIPHVDDHVKVRPAHLGSCYVGLGQV